MVEAVSLLKAIHARGGLLPASIHVFEAGWREKVDRTSGTHVYEKARSSREGYCLGNSRSSYRRVIRLPTAPKFSINVNFSLLLPII